MKKIVPLLCIFAVVAGVTALSGCGTTKIVYVQSTETSKATVPSTTQPATTGTGPLTTSPQELDTGEAVALVQRFLDAVDAQTGKSRWKFRTGAGVVSSPCVSNGVVFVGSSDGYIYALH